MDIRLMGTREEVSAVVEALRGVLDLQEVSAFYPNRGSSQRGRVYVVAGGVSVQPIQATAERTQARSQITGQGQIEQNPGGERA